MFLSRQPENPDKFHNIVFKVRVTDKGDSKSSDNCWLKIIVQTDINTRGTVPRLENNDLIQV